MVHLFTPFSIKSIEFKNRIWVSPMCQYSSRDGHPTDWHFVHLGSRAVGGAGLIIVEATAVSPEGRISPSDSGIWSDAHVSGFERITRFVKENGARIGIQLAHAGRKASTAAPWDGGRLVPIEKGGWETLGPSRIPFREGYSIPREMNVDDMKKVVQDFAQAALRSLKAGFEVVEIHAAHGYLLHEFLSPLSNQRRDEFGGSIENRMRFPLEVARAVRQVWPTQLPLFARISATDWSDQGWQLSDSVEFCRELKTIGFDLIDCSSGGTLAAPQIPVGPGYQVPFAKAIREEVGLPTAAVGMITEPQQAEAILAAHQADAIFLGREFLRDPYWPFRAEKALLSKVRRPKQYERA